MMKNALNHIRFLSLICIAVVFPAIASSQPAEAKEKLVYFFSAGCNKCQEVKAGVLAEIERDYSGRVEIEPRDIADIENYKLLLGIREKVDPTVKIG
ncbi:MAG: hypothetical protein WCY10_06310, partial [Candidatus Omnitrophota bacterium]